MAQAIIAEYKSLLSRRAIVEDELTKLPKGYISYKTINGKKYPYLQSRNAGRIVSEYLKSDALEDVKQRLLLGKRHEAELAQLAGRMEELEHAARLIGGGLVQTMLLLKNSAGMDGLDYAQKERCISFATAMNAIEGVPVSEPTAQAVQAWQTGQTPFLSVFEATLKRYGFPCGGGA